MPKNKKFFEIKNLSEEVAEIKVYGTITKWAWEKYGEVSSKSFAEELEKYKNVSKINLRVNSPGGDVFEASAIYNFLKNFAKENNIEVIGYIDGLAASAASVVILAANKIIMGLGTLFMIHNPWTYASGNKEELSKTIEKLDLVKEAIVDIYMTKTTKTREHIEELMNKEKWFKPNEAKEYGFVDEIGEDAEETLNNIKNIVGDLCISNYAHPEIIKAKLEEIKNLKNKNEGEKMFKNLQELKEAHPELLAEYEQEIMNKIASQEKERIENAILTERKRIQALEEIPVLNKSQKEIINKAKYEEPRDSKDIMVDFFKSNANIANNQINAQKAEAEKNGFNNIGASHSGHTDDEEAGIKDFYTAAAEAYKK